MQRCHVLHSDVQNAVTVRIDTEAGSLQCVHTVLFEDTLYAV